MMLIAVAGLVILADWLLVAACFPTLRLGTRARAIALTFAGACIASSPLLLSASSPALRLAVAIVAIWQMCLLYDLHIGAALGSRPSLSTLLRHIPNPAWVVCRKPPVRTTTDREDRAMFVSRVLGLIPALGAAWVAFAWDWRGIPFLFEHAAKGLIFIAIASTFGCAIPPALRLLGQPAMDALDRPLLAHSPLDFWRRWNRPAQQFFHEDIFRPAGGRRAPVRATLVTFFVSAVAHEYLFDIVAGRILGLQFTFFMIHGIAAVLTARARRTPVNIALTFVFNLVTSVLFFSSLDTFLPFYSNPLPAWVPGSF